MKISRARLFAAVLLGLLCGYIAVDQPRKAFAITIAPKTDIAANPSWSGIYLGKDETGKWYWTAYLMLDAVGFADNKYYFYPIWWDAQNSKAVPGESHRFNPYGQGYTGNVQSWSWSITIPLESDWGQAILWYGVGVEYKGILCWDDPVLGIVNIKECQGTLYPD